MNESRFDCGEGGPADNNGFGEGWGQIGDGCGYGFGDGDGHGAGRSSSGDGRGEGFVGQELPPPWWERK